MKAIYSFATAVGILLGASAAQAATYTLGQGFSNQGPIWQYGSWALGGPYPDYVTSFLGNPSIQAWADTSQPQFAQYGTPSVYYNGTASGVTQGSLYLPAGQVAFHPGENGQDSGVVFIAPKSGEYNVTATFTGLDFVGPTDTKVLIGVNSIGNPVGTVAGYGGGGPYTNFGLSPVVNWSGSEYLNAGDGLYFGVQFDPSQLSGRTTGEFYYDTTGVSVSISSVPESSTWAMMLLGFAALGFAGYRRNNVATLAQA